MDPFGQGSSRAELIRIARKVAGDPADGAAFLRRFRAAYLHLAATVDGAAAQATAAMSEMGPGWSNYMPAEMMPRDPAKLRQNALDLMSGSEERLTDLG